jgi:hypothetical protein
MHLIPKNASSFIAGHLTSLGWKKIVDLNNFTFKKGLVIIRDPLTRWASGIFEFFSYYHLINENFNTEWQTYKKLLYHNPIVDGHTSPQEEFLYKLDLDKLNFIFMPENQNISPKIQSWLSNNGYSNVLHKEDKLNEAVSKTNEVFAYNLIKNELLNNKAFKENLRYHFKSSYDLIDWIGKNNKWI